MGNLPKLVIRDLSSSVSLGCTAEERATPQEVRIDLELHFSELPEACKSDRLSDTICYARLSELVLMVCARKSYETVEHLTFCCFEELRKSTSPEVKLNVSVHKVRPPVPQLKGGVVFTYGDFL